MAGQDPDQAYIDTAMPDLKQRVVLGGARVAALMVDIYGNNSTSQTFLN